MVVFWLLLLDEKHPKISGLRQQQFFLLSLMGNDQWAALTQSLSYSCCQMEKRNLEVEAGGVGVLAVSLCVISGPLHMSLSQSKLGFLPSQGLRELDCLSGGSGLQRDRQEVQHLL